MFRTKFIFSLFGNTNMLGCVSGISYNGKCNLSYEKINNVTNFGIPWQSYNVQIGKSTIIELSEHDLHIVAEKPINIYSVSIPQFEKLLDNLNKTYDFGIRELKSNVVTGYVNEMVIGGNINMDHTITYVINSDGTYDINDEYETSYYEYSDGMNYIKANYNKSNVSKEEFDKYIKGINIVNTK